MTSLKFFFRFLFKQLKKRKKCIFLFSVLIVSFYLWNFGKNYILEKKDAESTINEIVFQEKTPIINPVLAKSKNDLALVSLIYSPFLKEKNGEIKGNIITVETKDSGKKYILKLNKNAFFHDGQKVDLDDVYFTLQKIKDPEINSPLRPYFIDTKISLKENQIEIILSKENYYFKKYLSKIYLLPKHIWKNISNFSQSNYNTSPVGSGPYKIQKVNWIDENYKRNLKSIVLVENQKNKSDIHKIIFHFFRDLITFKNSELYSQKDWKYINIFQTEDNLKLKDFIKKDIQESIIFRLTIKNNNSNKFLKDYKIRKYIQILTTGDEDKKNNFKTSLLKDKDFSWDTLNKLLKYKNELISFSVVVGENSDNNLLRLAQNLKSILRSGGIDLKIIIVDKNNYYSKLFERKYESIISGYKTDEDYLIYYFHSSQKNFPGVNVAQFSSDKIDKILENLRKNISEKIRKEKLQEFRKEIDSYYVLLNLEQKHSYYYLSKDIQDLNFDKINSGIERFKFVNFWKLK